jgi:hypothetical protein
MAVVGAWGMPTGSVTENVGRRRWPAIFSRGCRGLRTSPERTSTRGFVKKLRYEMKIGIIIVSNAQTDIAPFRERDVRRGPSSWRQTGLEKIAGRFC